MTTTRQKLHHTFNNKSHCMSNKLMIHIMKVRRCHDEEELLTRFKNVEIMIKIKNILNNY